MRRFNIRKNVAIRKWHSRARLIDIRKTKITLIMLGESNSIDFDKKTVREEVIATPVTVISGTGEIREPWNQGLDFSEEADKQIEGTPVEISPM